MIATVRKLTVCQFTTLHNNMECSQQRNPSSRHCLNAVIIIRCRPPKDTSALFPGKFFYLHLLPHLPSIYHLVYYLCNLSQSFTMSSSESTGAITLDSSSIIMIAIWCFIGVAFLFMGCCCSCCVSLSPSSLNLHIKLTYILNLVWRLFQGRVLGFFGPRSAPRRSGERLAQIPRECPACGFCANASKIYRGG